MARKEADRFEDLLQQTKQGNPIEGELAPLVQTAQLVSTLAGPPPPPPGRLVPGRSRFLAQASRLRTMSRGRQRASVLGMEKIKLAGALIAVLLAVWLILGVGQAAAASLPGEPLYGLKLAAEKARLELTSNPEARSELAVGLMGERLDEITALVEQGQTVDQPTVDRAREHLALAQAAASQVTGEAAPRVVERFLTALQERQQRMMGAMAALPQSEQTPVRELLREMDRVRQQLHTGRGEPSGEQERLRQGAPVEATDMPSPAGPHGPSRQPTDRSDGPNPTEDPGYGPGPQPTDEPAGPKPTEGPGQGPGPQPTDRPMRSQPTDDPGHGPGPQPTEPPQGAGDGGSPGDRTGEGGDGRAGRRP